MRLRLIISAVLIIVIAPLLAYATSLFLNQQDSPVEKVNSLTKEEAIAAIRSRNAALPESDQYNDEFSVDSIERAQEWWYIAVIDMDGSEQSVLLSKFSNDNITAVTSPGVGLPYANISNGLGVPYDVIEKLDKSLEGHGHEQE